MGLRKFFLTLCNCTLMMFTQFSWANLTTPVKKSDCNPIENGQITLINIEHLSAEECFEFGKCEYLHHNFSTAYTFFLSAQLKGHENTPVFNTYFDASKSALDSLQQINQRSFNYINTLNASSSIPFSDPLKVNERDHSDNYNKSLQDYIRNFLFLIVALGGFYLAFNLLIKHRKDEVHNIFLSIFLFGISVMLLELAVYWLKHFNYNPKVYFFKIHFFLWAPSLYLYIRKKLNISSKTTINEIAKHYSIFFISCILLLIVVNTELNTTETSSIHQFITSILQSQFIKSVHSTLYLILLISLYKKHKDIIDQSNKKWLMISISFLGLIVLIVYSRSLFSHLETFNYISKYVTAIILSLFIYLYFFMLYLKPDIITKTEVMVLAENNTKYKNSGLTEAMTNTLKIQLIQLIETKKVYLDNAISLEKLAKELNTDRYSLSQVINQEFGKNFYEFINDYRVEEAVNIIKNNKGKIKLVTDLIYESGFNNKVSFYKAFKKRHDMTPSQYIKMQDSCLLMKS